MSTLSNLGHQSLPKLQLNIALAHHFYRLGKFELADLFLQVRKILPVAWKQWDDDDYYCCCPGSWCQYR